MKAQLPAFVSIEDREVIGVESMTWNALETRQLKLKRFKNHKVTVSSGIVIRTVERLATLSYTKELDELIYSFEKVIPYFRIAIFNCEYRITSFRGYENF